MQDETNKIISLAEASNITGYTQDYLGFLCRTGKLEGQKIGRNWTTTRSALEQMRFDAELTYGPSQVQEHSSLGGTKIPVKVLQSNGSHEVDRHDQILNPLPSTLYPASVIPLALHSFSEGESAVDPSRLASQSEAEESLSSYPVIPEATKGYLESTDPDFHQDDKQIQNDIKSEESGSTFEKTFVVGLPISLSALSQGLNEDSKVSPALVRATSLNLSKRNSPAYFSVATFAITLSLLASIFWIKPDLFESFLNNSNGGLTVTNKPVKITNQISKKNVDDGKVLAAQSVTQARVTPAVLTQFELEKLIMESLAAAESLGFFRGPQGPAGTNGTTGTNPSGPIYIQPYIPSVPTSSNPGGTLAGFTDLSSQRFITDDATIDDQLTVNGAATFAGDVEVTGTITAGGITGTINPGLTEGSIIFQGPAGLAQDNANFFWNNTSNRLGIGTLSPAANIHSLATTEQLRLGYDTTNYTSLTTSSTGVTTFSFNGSAPQAIFIPQVDSGSAFDFQDSAGDSLFRIDTSGRIVNVGENDGSAKFNIDATITSATSFIYGQNISVDADNSLFGNVNALNIELEGAFAGSTSTNGIRSFNTLNSTATQLFTNSVGNSGVTGIVSNSTVGHNAGLLGASFGSSSLNSGVFGTATSSSNSPVRNIGVVGQALNATNNIGGYFYLGSTTPSGFTSTALLANNGSQSAPIFIAQDNASQVFIIADGGNVGIGSDSSPVAGLTVGDDTGATIASGAGDAYVQNDLEVDGTLTVAGATTYSGALSVITTTSPQLTVGYDSSNKFTTAVASDGGTAWAMLGTDADLNINFAGATDGDFSINTDDLFVDTSNGRVGIGTAVPSYGLHVQNDLGLGISRSTGRFWQIVPDATDQSTLRILTNGNSNALVLSASSDSYSKIYSESPIMSISGANAGSLYLNVGEPGSGGSVILGKRVGDDLILPTKYEFYAAGAKTANYSGVLFNNTATSSTGSVNKYGLEIQNTGTWDGSSANNVGLYVSSVTGGTNNYDAIFNGGGNVGIGTMTPAAKLEVTNNADSSTLLQITNTTAGTSAQAALQVTSNAGYVGFYKYSTTRTTYKTAVAPDAILYNSAGGNITILNDNASGNINFTAGGASTAQMVINNLGNVGIGTSAPLSGKLDIRGPLGTASWKTLPTDGTGGFNYGLAFVQDDSTASGTTGYFRMVNTDGTLVSGRNILGLQIAGGGDHLLVPGNTGLVDMSADNIFRFCGGSGSCITASELQANKIRLSPSFATADALTDPGDGGVHFPGNSYFATSTGSVGVATATPRSKLEVYGDLRYGGSSPISATTVSDNPLTLGATTVNVSSTTGYPTSGTLVIDSESMTYTGISGNAFTGVTRGVLGTTAVSHVSGSRIDYYLSIAQRNDTTPKFTLTSAGRAAFGRATASTSYSGGLYPTVEIGALDNTFPQAVTGSAYLSLNSGAGAIPGLVFARDSVQQWVIVDRHDDPGRLSFMNATSSQIFNFLQNGSFGINDTSPDANLEVVNDGIGDSFLVADSADGDTTPFVINSVGRVGIGTATPTATETYSYLTVQGSDATAVASTVINTGIGQAANVLSNATARWSMYIPAGGTALNFYSNTSTDVVTFANDGDVGIGTISPDAKLEIAGNLSSAAWGVNGIQLQATAATYTDSSTGASGTATNAVFTSFGQPTLAASNLTVTTTNAATVYIAAAPAAGTNQTITNAYALWVDSGTSRFDGDVNVGSEIVMDTYGRIYAGTAVSQGYHQGLDAGFVVTPRSGTPSAVGMVVQGLASQAGDLTQWRNSSATVLATVNPRGEFQIKSPEIIGTATFELTGDIDPAASTTVTGTNTSFDTELMVGDRITVSGETRTVTAIASQTSLTVDTAFSDNANDTTPDRLPVELSVLDSSLNIDFIVQDNGNVGVGVATPGYKFDVQTNTASTYAAYFFNDGNDANRYGIQIQGGADDASGTTYYLRALDGDGGEVGYIANTSGTFALTDSSDVRTKTNITDTIEAGLATIMQLRVVDFNRLADPDGPRITGFIAQEVNEVYPKIVNESPNGYLGISKENLIPILVKAMQEQQAELQSVKSLAQSLQGLGNGILQVDSLVVNSHVAFNEDTVGQAKILGTDSKVRISFTKQYEYQPVVTVTPMEFATIPYRVTEVDVTGFTIEFASVIGYDVTFNWHSFGSKEGKLTISDGTKQDIAIIVPQAPNPNVAQIQENNLVVDGSGTVPIDGQAPTESGVINETSSPQILEVPQGDSGAGGGNGNGNGNTGLPTIQEIVPVSSESSPST